MLSKVRELSIIEYAESLNINPDQVYYNRTNSSHISEDGAHWNVIAPSQNALLLSFMQIRWTVPLNKYAADGTTIRNWAIGDKLRLKPFCPVLNSTENVNFTINSSSTRSERPRYYSKVLGMLYGGNGNFSTSGGDFNSLMGHYLQADAGAGAGATVIGTGNFSVRYGDIGDKNLEKEMLRFNDLMQRSNGVGAGANSITWTEPVMHSCLNPFALIQDKLPKYTPWAKMSPVIPYVRDFSLDYEFKKLTTGCFLPISSIHSAGTAVSELNTLRVNGNMTAELLSYWYIPSKLVSIPPKVSVPSYEMVRHIMSSPSMKTINNNTADTFDTGMILLKDVPDLIIVHLEVDKNSTTYVNNFRAISPTARAEGGGTPDVNVLQPDNNAFDTFLEISSMRVNVGNHPNAIDTNFTQEELYNLTVKNGSKDVVYGFAEWRGKRTEVAANNYPSQCYVALRTSDISVPTSPGVKAQLSLQITGNVVARTGYGPGIAGGNRIYSGYVHLLYGKRFITLENDFRASHKKQSVNVSDITKFLK